MTPNPTKLGSSTTVSFDGIAGEFSAHYSEFRWIPTHLYLQVFPPAGTREQLTRELEPVFAHLRQAESALGGSGLDIESTVGLRGEFRFHLIPQTVEGAGDRLKQLQATFGGLWAEHIPANYRHELRLCEQ